MEVGSSDESQSIGKKNLRELQDHQAPRRSPGHLQERTAQAAAGEVASMEKLFPRVWWLERFNGVSNLWTPGSNECLALLV